MRQNRAAVLWLALGLVAGLHLGAIWGCGGGDSGGGSSLREEIVRATNEPEAATRAGLFMDIAVKQAKARDLSGSETSLESATKACREIQDPATRATLFAKLAETYYSKLDRRSDARRALEAAHEAADAIESPESKAKNLAAVGRAQGVMGDAKGAAGTLQDARKIADGIKDVKGRADVMGDIAAAYQKAGDDAEADRVAQAILTVAETSEDQRARADAIAVAASTQSKIKKKPEAEKSFGLAVEAARKISDPYSQVMALVGIGEKLAAAGFGPKAQDVLKEAENLCAKIKQADLQIEALDKARATMDKVKKRG